MAKGQVLVAGDGWHIHWVLLGSAGGRAHRALLDSLLTTAGAVKAIAVLGGLVALAAQRALAQGAPWITVEVRLAAACFDFLHEADVTASTWGSAASPGVVPAPVLHLAVGAEAPVVRLSFEGPIVDLDKEEQKSSVNFVTGDAGSGWPWGQPIMVFSVSQSADRGIICCITFPAAGCDLLLLMKSLYGDIMPIY